MTEFTSTEILTEGNNDKIKNVGIGMLRAAFLMATQVSGSGVLALPKAASDTGGWTGVGIMILLCINAVYADMHLGYSWIIIERKFPELKGPLRNPYPTIGERAFGPWARHFIAITLQITLIGAGTVYLILASEILDRQLQPYTPTMDTCLWMLVLAAVLCPVMWLGSFKDFWGFGVLGFGTIITASVIATVTSVIDLGAATSPPDTSVQLTVQSFFLGFGVIMFAFGGAGIFPTIQNDMSSRQRFPMAVVLAFTAILAIYVPVTVSGFAAYGHDLQSNIFGNLTPGTAVTIAELLIAADLMIIFILTTNPAMNFFEMVLSIEPKFGWKRVLVRTGSLLFMLFLGQSVRDFGKVLALVGGSTTVLLNLVVPATLYLRLCAIYQPEKPIELWRKIYLYGIIVLGLIGGTAATYAAFADIFSSESFRKPCYIP